MLRLVLPGCFFLCGFSSLDDGWCFLCERIVNKGLRFEKKIKHATLLFIWTSNLRLTSYSGTPTHRLVEQNHHPKIQKITTPWKMLRACQDGLGTHLVWWFIRQGQALWSLQVWCIECHQWLSRCGKKRALVQGFLLVGPLERVGHSEPKFFGAWLEEKPWNLSHSKVKG